MPIIELKRSFLFNGVSLPDPDPSMSEEEVLKHYAAQHAALRRGKVEFKGEESGVETYILKASEFKPNG